VQDLAGGVDDVEGLVGQFDPAGGRVHEDLEGPGQGAHPLVAARRAAEALAIPAEAIAGAIAYAIGQPPDVDVNELIVRPTAQR
jgi:NADP-dependent 3-hydroxy acid dehydrogenase YdfG